MNRLTLLAGLLAMAALPSAVISAPVIFDDRDAFVASVSPNASEDFESAVQGASYRNQQLTVGQFGFQGGEGLFTVANVNQIGPQGSCGQLFSVDGSQFACNFLERANPVRINFLSPITAWGADFLGIGNNGRETSLSFFDADDNLLSQTIFQDNGPLEVLFFGVDLMDQVASYAQFDFLGIADDGDPFELFSLDNITFSIDRGDDQPAPVPLPAGFVLLLTALGGLGLRKAIT